MKQRILICSLMVIPCQLLGYSREACPKENNDSSVVIPKQVKADTLAETIQSLNKRIDIQIDQQRTSQNIALLISLFAAIAAIASAVSSIKQSRNSKLQKKITLSERRFQIYDILRRTMVGAKSLDGHTLIKESGYPTYIQFMRGIMDMELFFRKDTCDEISKIQEILKKMYSNALEIENEQRLRNVDRIEILSNDMKMLSDQIDNWIKGETSNLIVLFRDYLEFRDP